MKTEFWIIILLFVFVVGYVIISNNKIARLQDQLLQEKQRNTYVIDSLEIESKQKEDSVLKLECSIECQNEIIDSLRNVKSYTKLITPETAKSTSESVKQLKDILCVLE